MIKEVVGEVPWAKVLGMVEDLICKLRHGKILPGQLAAFLRGENPFVNSIAAKFPIFKTITLGVWKSIKDYREALINAGFRIGDWARDILNKIQVSRSQAELDLVVRSVAELGFKEVVRLDRIYAKAKELGFELCPSEVGPALRLVYPDQPYGEWLWIAMEPISDSGGELELFEVSHGDDRQWLNSDYGSPVTLWPLDRRFIFVLPRKR